MRRTMWVVGLGVLLCALSVRVSAQEFDPEKPHAGSATLDFQGTPDDYISGGKKYHVTPADGTWGGTTGDFDKDGRPDAVSIHFMAGENAGPLVGSWWDLDFNVYKIPGAALAVGEYKDAQRASFADPGHPGIDVTGDGRGCNTIAGEFKITAFEYDCIDTGSTLLTTFHLRRFVATFKQHCEAGTPFLTGSIDYTAPASGFACPGSDGGGDGGDSPEPPPPPPSFQAAFDPSVWMAGMNATNASTQTVPFEIFVDETFNADVNVSVHANAAPHEGFDVSVEPAFFAAPGSGKGNVTVTVGPNTLPRSYTVTVLVDDGQKVQPSSFLVNVVCTPPFILGVDQPQFTAAGANREIEVKVSGSGPFQYEWFRGFRGMTREPMPSTGAKLTVPNDSARYWVRVRNACGSVDSEVAAPRMP